jgi:hypothetical protein
VAIVLSFEVDVPVLIGSDFVQEKIPAVAKASRVIKNEFFIKKVLKG